MWAQRKNRTMGYEAPGGKPVPLIELSQPGSDERSILESLSNHIGAKGARREEPKYVSMPFGDDE